MQYVRKGNAVEGVWIILVAAAESYWLVADTQYRRVFQPEAQKKPQLQLIVPQYNRSYQDGVNSCLSEIV